MKKRLLTLIPIFLIAITIVLIVGFRGSYGLYDVSEEATLNAYNLLNNSIDDVKERNTYFDYINNVTVKYDDKKYKAVMSNGIIDSEYGYNGEVEVLSYNDYIDYEVLVDEEGYYNLKLDVLILDRPLTNYNLSIMINNEFLFDEAERIDVPILWEDDTKNFPLDSYGDQTQPKSNKIDRWITIDMYDNKYSTDTPLLFKLKKGSNSIRIKLLTGNGRLVVGDLDVAYPIKVKSYSEYINAVDKVYDIKEKSYFINSISYIEKNSSYIRMNSLDKSFAEPYDVKQKMLNIIDGGSWNDGGQEITYEIDVEETGLYSLDLYYRNNKNEYSIFRSIYIDGKVPFKECLSYEFPCTDSRYELHTLGNEEGSFKFYLTAGMHRITLKAEVASLYSATTKLQLVIDHINHLALEVLKITGSDIDEDRTWDITKYIPETKEYLNAYNILLENIVNELSVYSEKGPNSASIAYIQRAIKLLEEVKENPKELPLYLDTLYSGTSSINQLLGDVINNITQQPMHLESLYVNSLNAKVDVKKNNIFKNFGNVISKLLQTFFSEKYETQTTDENTIVVWVNRPITYIDTMQRMIDADYNQNHEIKVKLSAMPDQSKLTLSVAADNAPDVVLGVQSYIPYDLAIRGGVCDLTQFEDFYLIANRFPAGSLLSFVVSDENGDRIYGIPETLDFNVIVYREDIFNALSIPTDLNTWNDLIAILPSLQRYGMNFYMPIAADNSTKWFYQTSSLLLQAGGSLYSEDGLSAAINSPESIKGLELLTQLFTEKSLPTNVPSFYAQFRNGTLPIGVLNFGTYLQLKNAAPEIAGKWKIMLPLGTERVDEKGNEYIDRTYITSGTSCSIMSSSDHKEDAWEFLKWWTSTEIQSEFGYNLQSTYGPEYLWLSSNLDAILNSQFEQSDKEVILESLNWIVDVQRNPGQYMVERGLSNIWTSTVLSGEPLRVAIQNQVILMNREITKKMKEFRYLDGNGNVKVQFYTRDINWIEEKIRMAADKK